MWFLTPDKIQTLLTEAAIYGALARALGPDVQPLYDASLLEELKRAVASLSRSDLSERFAKVRDVARQNGWSLENLQLEYTRLFEKSEARPYETSFDKTRPYGKPQDLADIAGFYRAFGVKPNHELPDYIVCELEFLSLLCLKEGYAVAHGLAEQAEVCSTAQEKFIREHLGQWLGPFDEQIHKCAKLPVYPALVDFIRHFVAFHASTLGVKLPNRTKK